MKKFGKILVCLLLCVFSIGLFACKKSEPDNFYQTGVSRYVSGNGGLAVESDGYLYFVNGFIACGNQEDKDATYTLGSLKVAKLYNGNLQTDSYGSVLDEQVRTMCSRLCGFEASGIYIYNNNLFFTAPCQEDLKGGGGWAKERVVFYHMPLDNNGKTEEIYLSNVNYDSLNYEYFSDGENVYIMLCETEDGKTALRRINAFTGEEETLCEEVESYAFVTNADYSAGRVVSGKVFYTEEDDDYQNYVLYNPITGQKKITRNNQEITVLYATNNYVFYTTVYGNINRLECFKITNNSFAFESVLYEYNGDETFKFNNDNYVFVQKSGKLTVVANPNINVSRVDLIDEQNSITILGFANGGVVYYDGTNAIKFVSLNGNVSTVCELETISTDHLKYASIANNKVYFYATIEGSTTNNLYLHQASVFGGGAKLVGVLEEEDRVESSTNQEA